MAHTSAPLPHPFPHHSDFIPKQQSDLSSFFGFPLFKLVDVLSVTTTHHTTNQKSTRRSRSIFEPSQQETVSFCCSPIVFECSNGMSIPPTKQHRKDLRCKRCWNGYIPHLLALFLVHPLAAFSTILVLLFAKPFEKSSFVLHSSHPTSNVFHPLIHSELSHDSVLHHANHTNPFLSPHPHDPRIQIPNAMCWILNSMPSFIHSFDFFFIIHIHPRSTTKCTKQSDAHLDPTSSVNVIFDIIFIYLSSVSVYSNKNNKYD